MTKDSEDSYLKIIKLYKSKCEQLNIPKNSAVIEALTPKDEKGSVLDSIALDSSVDYHREPLKASLNSLLSGRTFPHNDEHSLPRIGQDLPSTPLSAQAASDPPCDGLGDGGGNALVTALLCRTSESEVAPYTALKLLKVNGWRLSDEGIKHMADLLHPIHALELQHLELMNNSFSTGGAIALADSLQINSVLTTLRLDLNNMGDGGIRVLCNGLSQNEVLTTLTLSCCNIGIPGTKGLAFLLAAPQSVLKVLDIHGNQGIGPEGLNRLCEGLRNASSLKSLNLQDTGIGNTHEHHSFRKQISEGNGSIHFQEAVTQCMANLRDSILSKSVLQHLDLQHNVIPDMAAEVLLPLVESSSGRGPGAHILASLKVDSTLSTSIFERLWRSGGGGSKKGKKGKKGKKKK